VFDQVDLSLVSARPASLWGAGRVVSAG